MTPEEQKTSQEKLMESVCAETAAMLRIAEALGPFSEEGRDRILRATLILYEPVLRTPTKTEET